MFRPDNHQEDPLISGSVSMLKHAELAKLKGADYGITLRDGSAREKRALFFDR